MCLNVYFLVIMLNAKIPSFFQVKLFLTILPGLAVRLPVYPVAWACAEFTGSLSAYWNHFHSLLFSPFSQADILNLFIDEFNLYNLCSFN